MCHEGGGLCTHLCSTSRAATASALTDLRACAASSTTRTASSTSDWGFASQPAMMNRNTRRGQLSLSHLLLAALAPARARFNSGTCKSRVYSLRQNVQMTWK